MRSHPFKLTLWAACVLLANASHATTAPPTTFYSLKELGNSQNGNTPLAINNLGEAVGVISAGTGSDSTGALFWTAQGELKVVSPLAPRTRYVLRGLNNTGQLIGLYSYSGAQFPQPGPTWNLQDLPGKSVVPIQGAVSVNDHGLVATSTGLYLLSSGERLADFSTLGGSAAFASAVGNGGLVVGSYRLADQSTAHAAVWSGSSGRDLGTLGGAYSAAFDVNEGGVIVGEAQTAGNAALHAVRWDGYNGTPVDLGTLGGKNSSALAVNKAGVVVGHAQDAAGVRRATMWVGNQAIDLNTLLAPGSLPAGVVLDMARDINDEGQILVRVPTTTGLDTAYTGGFLMAPHVPPVVTCIVSYAVTSTNLIGFTAHVTVNNMSNAPLTGWNVGWTYSANPFVIASRNVKLKVSGATVKATPVAANQTLPAQGSTVFTFTSLKGKLVPKVSNLAADLGGKACTTTKVE